MAHMLAQVSEENVEIVRRGYEAYLRGDLDVIQGGHGPRRGRLQVVVRVHQTAVGARSGAPIEADFWFVHTLRDARLTRLDMLVNKADALAAAGVSE